MAISLYLWLKISETAIRWVAERFRLLVPHVGASPNRTLDLWERIYDNFNMELGKFKWDSYTVQKGLELCRLETVVITWMSSIRTPLLRVFFEFRPVGSVCSSTTIHGWLLFDLTPHCGSNSFNDSKALLFEGVANIVSFVGMIYSTSSISLLVGSWTIVSLVTSILLTGLFRWLYRLRVRFRDTEISAHSARACSLNVILPNYLYICERYLLATAINANKSSNLTVISFKLLSYNENSIRFYFH